VNPAKLDLRVRFPIAIVTPRFFNVCEDVVEPEARLNLAFLGAEDGLLVGTAAPDDIFGAAPNAGAKRNAGIGITIVLHGG